MIPDPNNPLIQQYLKIRKEHDNLDE